jgi:hypothetical protein
LSTDKLDTGWLLMLAQSHGMLHHTVIVAQYV